MDVPYIPSSIADIERRRLESTLDHDLSSLSLAASSSMSHSFSSLSTLEQPRSAPAPLPSHHHHHHHHHHHDFHPPDSLIDLSFGGVHIPFDPRIPGLDDTPRPSGRARGMDTSLPPLSDLNASHTGIGASPISSAGHHVSAATIGAGVFRRKGGKENQLVNGDEFDPDRSLGRLVGELGKMVNERPRPVSPFTAHPTSPRSPRSPSPLPPPQLSFSLTRNDPLPSPPNSRSGSGSSYGGGSTRFTSLARDLGGDIDRAKSRRVLGETGRDNVPIAPVPKGYGKFGQQEGPRRTSSAPARTKGRKDHILDVTGMTGLMATPAKGVGFVDIPRNTQLESDRGAIIPETLATLGSRITALEMENSVSRNRVKELEAEIVRAKAEVEAARREGSVKLREAINERSALEDLVRSLRDNLARLTTELDKHKLMLTELRTSHARQTPPRSTLTSDPETASELAKLRAEVERLAREIHRLGTVVEQGINARRDGKRDEEREEEMARVRRDVEVRSRGVQVQVDEAQSMPSRLRQGLHTVASSEPGLAEPTPGRAQPIRTQRRVSSGDRDESHDEAESATSSPSDGVSRRNERRRSRHSQPRASGPGSPFPSIIAEEDEREFFAALSPDATVRLSLGAREKGKEKTSSMGAGKERGERTQSRAKLPEAVRKVLGRREDEGIPPQTVLARVIRELEDEFGHYKAIYVEIAEQYGLLDAASAVAKRHVLAEHLKEVIDTLEHKADQIASLYDLLHFSDKPNHGHGMGENGKKGKKRVKSVHEILESVAEALGTEARARLERDGFRLR